MMPRFMLEAKLDWRENVEQSERGLEKLDAELKEESARKDAARKEELKEFFDPLLLEKRAANLKTLQSSLRKLSDNAREIQLKIRMALVPGVHLYVRPENQSHVADFCPKAYDIIRNESKIVDGLKTLALDGSTVAEKLNKEVVAMADENRTTFSRLQQIRRERVD